MINTFKFHKSLILEKMFSSLVIFIYLISLLIDLSMPNKLTEKWQQLRLDFITAKRDKTIAENHVGVYLTQLNEGIDECMNKHPEHNDSIDEFLECADTLYSDKYNAHLLKEIQAYQGNIEKRYEVKAPTTPKMMQILKRKHDKRANLSDIKKLENIVDEFRKNIFDYFIKVCK
ncbi:hypothetical protein KSF78_0008994 [Schistosoma japonicum]|nr:hypothetical protein KSF78_0008994 [Schistosoma japonicum]